MSRSVLGGLGLLVVAIICCAGIPLLLGGAGLTVLAGFKGGFGPAIIVAIVVIAAIGAYVYFKRHRSSDLR